MAISQYFTDFSKFWKIWNNIPPESYAIGAPIIRLSFENHNYLNLQIWLQTLIRFTSLVPKWQMSFKRWLIRFYLSEILIVERTVILFSFLYLSIKLVKQKHEENGTFPFGVLYRFFQFVAQISNAICLIMHTFLVKFWHFLAMHHLNDRFKASLALRWTNHLHKPSKLKYLKMVVFNDSLILG